MEENMNIPQDQLTQRIVSRLGERQQKLEQMAKWEKARDHKPIKARVRPLYYFTAIAACIAILLIVAPWSSSQDIISEMGIETPELTTYRAANAEANKISSLIKDEKYEDALTLVSAALKKSEDELKLFQDFFESMGSEEDIYELQAEIQQNNELRWTRIYLLLKLDMKKEARKELKEYLRYPDYCQHLDEAKALKEKLR